MLCARLLSLPSDSSCFKVSLRVMVVIMTWVESSRSAVPLKRDNVQAHLPAAIETKCSNGRGFRRGFLQREGAAILRQIGPRGNPWHDEVACRSWESGDLRAGSLRVWILLPPGAASRRSRKPGRAPEPLNGRRLVADRSVFIGALLLHSLITERPQAQRTLARTGLRRTIGRCGLRRATSSNPALSYMDLAPNHI